MKGLGAVHFPTCRQDVPMKLDHREAREFIIVRGEMTSYAFLFTPDSKPYIRTVRISASRAGGLTLMQVICILKLSSCGSWFDEAASGPKPEATVLLQVETNLTWDTLLRMIFPETIARDRIWNNVRQNA